VRILFYVEPVTYRDDPLFLAPWIGWIAQLIQNARLAGASLQFGLATSAALSAHLASLGTTGVSCACIAQREALIAFDFDRDAYARDLFRPTDSPVANRGLADQINSALEKFSPDIIVSFSQNRYIRRCERTQPLFWELGPLPRSCTPPAFFFDPAGHQTESMLVSRMERILANTRPPLQLKEAEQLWEKYIAWPVLEGDRTFALEMASRAKGRRVVLLALQPHDWLTYEGAWEHLPVSAAIMRWASQLPRGWLGVVACHPDSRINSAMVAQLEGEWPNLWFLPTGGRHPSESIVPHADAVATVSSSIGAQAVLWGKPLVAFGRSNLSAVGCNTLGNLDTARGLSREERLSLFVFLTHQYCHPLSSLLNDGRYFANWLVRWRDEGFTEGFFLDTSKWRPDRAVRLLCAPAP
jgi:hypothetical protein